MGDIETRIQELETAMADVGFWENKVKAQEALKELSELKAELAGAKRFEAGDAVLSILAGAGGDDAEDFAQMLYEMYTHFIEKKGFEMYPVHENKNNHGGYRNVTIEVRGKGAYGTLKHESGVHRLVRISPFNAKKLRHTSFALVDVIPKFHREMKIEIPSEDLRIEFARSGGPGGQNVNKRETAVRIVHIPTNISVHCTSERSQAQNREKALEILKGKLFKLREAEQDKREAGMGLSKTTDIEWGNQIRSYVLHPYKLVKDHRTDYEEQDPDRVLAGELDGFIEAERGL